MAKAPQDPREIFPQLLDDYKGLFGEDLVSIILYGSAVGENYRPGKSDINFMIVLSEEGIEHLDKAFGVVRKWQKQKVAIPLFLTEAYVESSLDVFPLEYLNFQRHYVLVHGKDVLKDLSFDPESLRLQCEREIKGKLLLLREAFMETGGKGRVLRGVIARSLPAFMAVFEGLLHLKGEELPSERHQALRRTCEIYDLDGALFERLLDIKEERLKPGDEEIQSLFKGYLKEARRLSKLVDTLGG